MSFSLSISLSFSLSHPAMARSNKRDSHSKFAISQTRRASLRVQHEFARSFLFLSFCLYLFFFLSLSPRFSRRTTQTFFYSLRDEIFFYFVSWFFFVLLSVEAIYYFKRHCSYDIDRLLWKKRSPDFRYLFLSYFSRCLSLSPALAHCHSLLFELVELDATSSVFYFCLRHTSPQRASFSFSLG